MKKIRGTLQFPVFIFLFLISISIFSEERIQFFYNVPPEDHPEGRGVRAGFIEQIDLAQESLEGAFYQINDPKIIDAFLRAAERGVRVEMVTDTDWVKHKDYREGYARLKKAGVKVVDDRRDNLSHNKYCIIDRNFQRARVWMGSTNMTTQCNLENGNASFLLISPEVAEVFYLDFQQMIERKFQKEKGGVFQSNGSWLIVRDQSKTPAGLDSKDFLEGPVSYPSVSIDGFTIEIYFSPRHNIERKVIEALYSAKESIHFLTYTFDNPMIYQTIMNKAKVPGDLSRYNLYPVAIRQHPWEEAPRVLRVAEKDGVSFRDKEISDNDWETMKKRHRKLFGKQNKGKFYDAARLFYLPAEEGGEIKKVSVYGVINRLGSSKGPYQKLINDGIAVRMSAFPGALHHKLMIIDKEILILGSYNFSASAENKNDESAIIIRSKPLVEEFYRHVFVPTYQHAYPEYVPQEEELSEYIPPRKEIAISEIHFFSKKGSANKYVEIHNYSKEKSIYLRGWKLWNGLIPWHKIDKIRGTTDDLVSYYHDPYENKYGMNHELYGYFLKPELEVLKPGEYALIVGRDFDPSSLDPYLEAYEKQFEKIYGRKPKESYEKYPKLFVSAMPSDRWLGDGLKPFQFITLFYTDKFTMADRFMSNLSFLQNARGGDMLEQVKRKKRFEWALLPGQSVERIRIDRERLAKPYESFFEVYGNRNYFLYWHGLATYNDARDWEPHREGLATPGFN